jgi:hypothetical protein
MLVGTVYGKLVEASQSLGAATVWTVGVGGEEEVAPAVVFHAWG